MFADAISVSNKVAVPCPEMPTFAGIFEVANRARSKLMRLYSILAPTMTRAADRARLEESNSRAKS
jgi:hypothetical protein